MKRGDVADVELKEAWVALDADCSGYVSAGEFGKFMRRGEHVLAAADDVKKLTWRQRAEQSAKQKADARRACCRHGTCDATQTLVRLPTSLRYGPPTGALLKRYTASCASMSGPWPLPVRPPLEPTTAHVP